MTLAELMKLASHYADIFDLPEALVIAICKVESNWHPSAYRFEPAFKVKYVDKLVLDPDDYLPSIESERIGRSTSFGLMQIMGQKAREMGYKGDYLIQLCEPTVNLKYGCRLLYDLLKRYGKLDEAISAYNAGSPTTRNQAYVDKVRLEMKAHEDRLLAARNPRP